MNANIMMEKVRKSGFKLTPQRMAIFEFLDGRTDHPSAEVIYAGIRKKHPAISFATVYNTVQALKESGAVLELTIDNERRHYDPNTTPHHHVICTKCGKIGDVFKDFGLETMLPEGVGDMYKVSSAHVNFYGVCRDCQ
ncbi:MAG: transcriptional repressor [Deltaproteobacteria bacterium]|nr:transcriptional repressor [Deltaproteobacteria bacterium]